MKVGALFIGLALAFNVQLECPFEPIFWLHCLFTLDKLYSLDNCPKIYLHLRNACLDNLDELVDVVCLDAAPALVDHGGLAAPDPEPRRLLDDLVDLLERVHQLLVVVAADLVLAHQVAVDVVQLLGPSAAQHCS